MATYYGGQILTDVLHESILTEGIAGGGTVRDLFVNTSNEYAEVVITAYQATASTVALAIYSGSTVTDIAPGSPVVDFTNAGKGQGKYYIPPSGKLAVRNPGSIQNFVFVGLCFKYVAP